MATPPLILGGGLALGGLALVGLLAMAVGDDTPTPMEQLRAQHGDRPGKYFTWREFEITSRQVDNTLPVWAMEPIKGLVVNVLDPLREAVQRPVRVTSGFRSEVLNRLIGGAKGSQHMRGEAADIKVDGFSAVVLATTMVQLRLPFDQVIWYDPELGGHVHVSFAQGRGQRGEMLHAYRDAQGVKKYRAWRPAGVV